MYLSDTHFLFLLTCACKKNALTLVTHAEQQLIHMEPSLASSTVILFYETFSKLDHLTPLQSCQHGPFLLFQMFEGISLVWNDEG